MNIPFIDLHEDIADNHFILSHKDFFRENGVHEGWNEVDLPVNNQVDLPRLKKSAARLVFAAACPYIIKDKKMVLPDDPSEETFRQLDFYHDVLKKGRGDIFQVTGWKSYQQAIAEGKIGLLLHIEGADFLDETLSGLDRVYDLGVRSIGFTYNDANCLAGGALSNGRLTPLGKQAIARAQELGVIIDLAHLNQKSLNDALEIVRPPFMFSHGGFTFDREHPRNLTLEQARLIADKGGLVGVIFAPNLLSKNSLDAIVGVFSRLKKEIGTESIAIGSDFDGMISKDVVEGLEDVSKIGNLPDGLMSAGFTGGEIERIFYKNVEDRLVRLLAD